MSLLTSSTPVTHTLPTLRTPVGVALISATLLGACNLASSSEPRTDAHDRTNIPNTDDGRRITPFPAGQGPQPDDLRDSGGPTDSSADDTARYEDSGSDADGRDRTSDPSTDAGYDADADGADGGPPDARPAGSDTDTITNIETCPETVTQAAIDCVTERMTAPDSAWTGGWTEATLACATDPRTRQSLDQLCQDAGSVSWCAATGVGNHAAWVDACAWHVDYRVRDSLCVFETRWDESILTGRIVERSRQILSTAQMEAAADSELWAQALRVRWPDVERATTGFERVDPASLSVASWWDLTNDKSWQVLTYRAGSETWGLIVDVDRSVGAQIRNGTTEACRASEGVGARPCRDDQCGADRTCVGERTGLAGLCVDPTFEPDYVDCRAHTDCPVGFLCLPTADTLECRPAWTRRVVSSWLDRTLSPGLTLRTAITLRGLAPVGDQVAIWLHLDRALPWNATVWLMDPDGRPSVVPWSGEWTGWVPLPHAVSASDRNGTWQLELHLPVGSAPVLVEGWSLRVDSLVD